MQARVSLVGASALLIAGFAAAQTVTTSGGTTNAVPKFSGSTSLVNSAITEANGNVGIGVSNPSVPLEVSGYLHVTGDVNPATNSQGAYLGWNALTGGAGEADLINNQGGGGGGFAFLNTPSSGSPRSTLMFLDGSGNLNVSGALNGKNFSIPGVGGSTSWAKIGTFTASQGGESIQITAFIHNGFNASNSQDSTYVISFKTSNGSNVDANGFAGNGSWYAIGFNPGIPSGNIKWVANAPGANASSYDLYINLPVWTGGSFYSVTLDKNASWSNAGALVPSDPGSTSSTVLIPGAEFDVPYGNVGIGTNSSAAKLEVNGNVKLTANSGASIIFADGTTQSTAWAGTLGGGDYAESVNSFGDRKQYEPGDVLVLSEDNSADVVKSSSPYSTLVAGIYSTKPGVLGRRQIGEKTQQEIPMAMIGIVPTKVCAENGPIKRGDLLVTASTAGYAMKGTDPNRMFGAVVGKAIGSLDSGTGVIEVLVSLQ